MGVEVKTKRSHQNVYGDKFEKAVNSVYEVPNERIAKNLEQSGLVEIKKAKKGDAKS